MPCAQRRISLTSIGSRSWPPPRGMPTHLSTSEVSIRVRDLPAMTDSSGHDRALRREAGAAWRPPPTSRSGALYFAAARVWRPDWLREPAEAESAARRTTGRRARPVNPLAIEQPGAAHAPQRGALPREARGALAGPAGPLPGRDGPPPLVGGVERARQPHGPRAARPGPSPRRPGGAPALERSRDLRELRGHRQARGDRGTAQLAARARRAGLPARR